MLRHLVRMATIRPQPQKRTVYLHHTIPLSKLQIKHRYLNMGPSALSQEHCQFVEKNNIYNNYDIINAYGYGFVTGGLVLSGFALIEMKMIGLSPIMFGASLLSGLTSTSFLTQYSTRSHAIKSFNKFVQYKHETLNLNHKEVDKLLDDFIDYV